MPLESENSDCKPKKLPQLVREIINSRRILSMDSRDDGLNELGTLLITERNTAQTTL